MKRAFSGIVFLCLIFSAPPVSSAPQVNDAKIASANHFEVLKGLYGISISISNIEKDAEGDGLRKADIQTAVELKLRESGIKILTSSEASKRPESPCLYVQIETFDSGTRIYAYYIKIELHETVRLLRGKNTIDVGTATWSGSHIIGAAGKLRMDAVRDEVKNRIDEFCNAYLTANPIVTQKVIALTGAAAAYYWYNHHKNPEQNKEKTQYYISKAGGRIYYRDANHQAHWVTPPQASVEVAEDEAKSYKRFKGYNNQTTGDDLSDVDN